MTDRNDQKPACIPIKCVVCNGFGTVNWGKASCHACHGKGYILISAMEGGEEDGKPRRD